jgi:hypothetical protein
MSESPKIQYWNSVGELPVSAVLQNFHPVSACPDEGKRGPNEEPTARFAMISCKPWTLHE